MSELSRTKAYLHESGLAGQAIFFGCGKQELTQINALIHPHELPAAFQELYHCIEWVAVEVFARDYRFRFFDVPGNNEAFAEDYPNISSGAFNEVFVFASYPDGFCFYYLDDAVGTAEVSVHVTHDGSIWRSFPNLDTFLLEYAKEHG